MGAYEFSIFDASYIYVTPNSCRITAFEAGSNPAGQTITIKNYGTQTLNWSLDMTSKPAWLTINPISGVVYPNESEDVTLSIDITGLSAGPYSYSFDVVDPSAQNNPQTVTVYLDVIGPILEVSSNPVSFSALEGNPNPDPQSITISNPGGGILNWSMDLTGKPGWLMVTPTGGSLGHVESEDATLSVEISGLSDGLYSYLH